MTDEHWREPPDEGGCGDFGDYGNHGVLRGTSLLIHRDDSDNESVYFFRVDVRGVRDDTRDVRGFGVLVRFLAGGNSRLSTMMWEGV